MRFLPVNIDALLVELEDLAQTLTLHAALQAEPIPGVVELVPAARTILVSFRPSVIGRDALIASIAACDIRGPTERSGDLIEIPVRYNGEDLDDVAQYLGISREEVVRRHSSCTYTVAFTGFAPGYGYLTGGDPVFNVPRRKTPRTRVPAGSVALGGAFSCVYPKASPGGWQIIGVTDTAMWDLSRPMPALLQPGDRVRFIQETAAQTATTAALQPVAARQPVAWATPALVVRRTGLLAVFQDLGRHGQSGLGVSASGAMDRGALRTANRLVGNDAGQPCLELAYGGFEVECRGNVVLAVTGANVPLTLTSCDGRRWTANNHQPLALTDGDRLAVGQPLAGIRAYLAVRGGFDVGRVLGSSSTDTLAEVGPPVPVIGDVLAVLTVVHGGIVDTPSAPVPDLPRVDVVVTLDVVLGPRTDWLTPEAVDLLSTQTWQVTPQSNRIGIRLHGELPLTRAIHSELASEGTVTGAIQVPPSGQPVLFLADHPVTGGYPVVGAVAPYHLDRAGQIPVNARVRFRPISSFDPVEAGT